MRLLFLTKMIFNLKVRGCSVNDIPGLFIILIVKMKNFVENQMPMEERMMNCFAVLGDLPLALMAKASAFLKSSFSLS